MKAGQAGLSGEPGWVELLVVQDVFAISRLGLVVVPDFPCPRTGWQSHSRAALIVKPDGTRLEAQLKLTASHFNIRSAARVDQRWRIVPCFPDLTRDDVPVGSTVYADLETAMSLAPHAL